MVIDFMINFCKISSNVVQILAYQIQLNILMCARENGF